MSARKSLRVIEDILETGVSVITLNDGREYTLDSLDNDPLSLLLAILTFIRANEESMTKSQRMAAVWVIKRERALEKPLTSRCPGWIKISPDRRSFVIIPEHAITIRRIFDEARLGQGAVSIARQLNLERIHLPFGGGRKAKMWLASGISMILRNPATIGIMIPHQYHRSNGQSFHIPLEPIIDYFPAVIPKEQFDDLIKFQKIDQKIDRRKHLAFPTFNPIGWLARCSHCLGPMMLTSGSKPERYLICRRAYLKAGCTFHSIRYNEVEATIFSRLESVILEHKARCLTVSPSKLNDIIEILGAEKPDRGTLNRKLRGVISSIHLYPDLGKICINWKDGRVSEMASAFTPTHKRESNIRKISETA